MAALGMDMAIVPAIAVGSSDVATDECPLGHFRSFYYQSGLKCVLSETPYDAGLLSKATAAFASRNISVYIGLAEPEAPFHQPWNRTGEALTAWLDAWADLQKTLLHDVWASLGASTSIVAGVYTNMELYNNPAFREDAEQLAAHFYQPIADAASKLARPRSLDVLASPFYHGNTSNYKGELLSAAEYASVWNALRTSAPGLTKVALQDSVGWQGNSIAMAAEALDAFGSERALRGEHAWANIELFRATPAGCIFPESCGRAPAPWARVAAQLATEGPRASRLISWEWLTCLSPNTDKTTRALNEAYVAYLKGRATLSDAPALV